MSELSYSPDVFDLGDFSTASATQVGDTEFSTVEVFDIEEGEGVYVGRGTSSNPLQAEGSIEGNIKNGGNSDINGRYRLVVLNSQNNTVNGGVLARGRISELRKTRSNSLDGDIQPFVDKEVREPYQVGLQVRVDSGTETYSSSNSTLEIDGFLGEAFN
jgi:hypothetical protein